MATYRLTNDRDIAWLERDIRISRPKSLYIAESTKLVPASRRDALLMPGPRRGTRSLEESILRIFPSLAHNLRYDALKDLPFTILERIWHRLCMNRLTIETWTLFARLLPESAWIHLREPSFASFGEYWSMPKCISSSDAWVTLMDLEIGYITFEDLIDISRLETLAIFTLRETWDYRMPGVHIQNVDDRFVRNWSQTMLECGGFPNLQILSFVHVKRLTPRCLDFLTPLNLPRSVSFYSCLHPSSCPAIEGWQITDFWTAGMAASEANLHEANSTYEKYHVNLLKDSPSFQPLQPTTGQSKPILIIGSLPRSERHHNSTRDCTMYVYTRKDDTLVAEESEHRVGTKRKPVNASSQAKRKPRKRQIDPKKRKDVTDLHNML